MALKEVWCGDGDFEAIGGKGQVRRRLNVFELARGTWQTGGGLGRLGRWQRAYLHLKRGPPITQGCQNSPFEVSSFIILPKKNFIAIKCFTRNNKKILQATLHWHPIRKKFWAH